MSEFLDSRPEVEAALAEGRPVVALETTLIAHGLPPPQNLATARAMAQAVRAAGVHERNALSRQLLCILNQQ